MGSAFISGDYKTFCNYTYPSVVKLMGGASNMTELLTKATSDLKAKGMSFCNISFGEPSKILESAKELQATIAQHTEIKLPQGRILSTSTLIAISADNGNNWTFIDTSNKDIAALRKAFPKRSPSISIPPPATPVR